MKSLVLLAAAALSLGSSLAVRAGQESPSNELTAVSSKVFNGYTRQRLPDGTVRPEQYGFAVGGYIDPSTYGLEGAPPPPTSDDSIDKVRFSTIELAIEKPLSAEGYFPTTEPKNADILIVVFWGRTTGTSAFSQSGTADAVGGNKDMVDYHNAKLLGFDSGHTFDRGFDDPSNMMANIRREVYSNVRDAIGEDRYFIILRAYDFQHAWKQNKILLLWETRFSLTQRGHDFRDDLPRMAFVASPYFGQPSNGLQMREIPKGQVEIGAVKSLGEVPTDSSPPAPKSP